MAVSGAADGSLLDQPLCPACGAAAAVPLDIAGLDHLDRCRGCGLVHVRQMPSPDTLAALYGAAYYRSDASHVVGYEDYEADQHNIVATARRRLRRSARIWPQPGRLLDVGCALGFFMDAAQAAGWQVSGVDISPYAANLARARTGSDVREGQLDAAGFQAGSMDVVTMWDVIEHMTDPLPQLAAAHAVLADDGLLALTTPDLGSLMARLMGARWMGYKLADEHVYYYSRQTLKRILEASGFTVVQAFPVGKDVELAFFVKRLELYAPRLAALVTPWVKDTSLGRRSFYANPRDIVCIIARKAGPAPLS
jgi:2-polyprenyl-3-methyl-5-hydroxy-6-metoxy-1,4-benzoquinol methylase